MLSCPANGFSRRFASPRSEAVQHFSGYGSDMVLMAVSEDEGADQFAVLFEVCEIGRNDVDAQEFGVREHHSGIHHDDVIAVADGHGVHPELAKSAERDDLQLTIGHKLHRTW